jgi:hypothetical protein
MRALGRWLECENMKRGLLMFPVGVACGFFCGFVIAFLCVWFDSGPGDMEGQPTSVGEYIAVGIAFGGFGGMIGLVLAPVVYFIGFTRLSNRELFKAICLIVAGTISFGLLGGLSVNLFYAVLTTMLGFFSSSLAVYISYKDKSQGPVKDGVAV